MSKGYNGSAMSNTPTLPFCHSWPACTKPQRCLRCQLLDLAMDALPAPQPPDTARPCSCGCDGPTSGDAVGPHTREMGALDDWAEDIGVQTGDLPEWHPWCREGVPMFGDRNETYEYRCALALALVIRDPAENRITCLDLDEQGEHASDKCPF